MSLKIIDLHKSYHQGGEAIPVLKGVNLTVEEGSIVAILGESGSGKSTLLALLAGLDRPSAGSILLREEAIEKQSQDSLARWRGKNIGIVFQQYHLLPHLTAQENVELPLEILGVKDREKRATELLSDLSLRHRLHHLPRQLSGGESQRVAIARALAPNPGLLLADEPSGNLDADTGNIVMDAFFAQVRKLRTTTILVTHSRELAKRCDRELTLRAGALHEV
ncbi:MAG: ABC transporter ATP-binding protein [Proteobacteria bacterium]|nr:MAG: ABC transporter ATP-binding protein [Pseudomonadota bacterium]